jgi:hypothetical protein
MDLRRLTLVACALAGASGCTSTDAVLLSVRADAPAEQYDLYVRDDNTAQIIFHSGFNPVQAPGEKVRDLTMQSLKIALKLSRGGRFTLLLVGVIGAVADGKPAPGSTQLFWAGHLGVDGATEISALLLTVPDGDDADHDLWPDAMQFPLDSPQAANLYRGHLDLLDCDDKIDMPMNDKGDTLKVKAADINPFAVEICGDGYDENCNGNADEVCVDKDKDHDPRGSDCDDNDPKRHHATDIDPFPDPPNCCGYSLGKTGTPDEHTDFLFTAHTCAAAACKADMTLCPMKRCGDGIDESCRGGAVNDAKNDTACIVDNDCDGYPAPPLGNDCDDNDPTVHPGALEPCGSMKDLNCNGTINEGCVPCDLDGDGFQRNDPTNGCPNSTDQHPGMFDCNDNDSGVYPGQMDKFGGKEAGDGSGRFAASLRGNCRTFYESTGAGTTPKIPSFSQVVGDADCNGTAYEGCPPPNCDKDGDGWANNGPGCTAVGGTFDCDDNDPTVYPGAPDRCGDGKAQNCTGDTPCDNDADKDGYNAGVDCDDGNANIHPWAVEVCNGVDDDCDQLVDEGNPDATGKPLISGGAITTCTFDDDGECGKTKGRCVCSIAMASAPTDPAHRTFCPTEQAGGAKPPHCFGAGTPQPQSCDAVSPKDDDCDGRVDDPMGTNLALKGMPCGTDVGQCRPGVIVGCDSTQTSCFVQFGRSPANKKWYVCSSDAVCPTTEKCNGLDDDCDGQLAGTIAPPLQPPPVGTTVVDERDHDGDKYLACGKAGSCEMTLAPGLLGCGDCDDTNINVHPGAMEKCNNIDDDCDPSTPDGKDECNTLTCCSLQSACKNTVMGDTLNCGSCGKVCTSQFANACGGGSCLCGSSQPCVTNNLCNGGSCQFCGDATHCGPSCNSCGIGQRCLITQANVSSTCGCMTDAGCAAGQWCWPDGSCQNKAPLGHACGGGGQPSASQCCNSQNPAACTQSNCVDGVCCESACNGAGNACATCTASPAAPPVVFAGVCAATATPSGGRMCTTAVPLCAGSCDGTHNACQYPGGGMQCQAQACGSDGAGGWHTVAAKQCDSNGGCTVGGAVTPCNNYGCNGTSCFTTCTHDSDCKDTNYYCDNTGACVGRKGLGKSCNLADHNTGGGQCYEANCRECVANGASSSGTCQDGVCCNSGACPACKNCHPQNVTNNDPNAGLCTDNVAGNDNTGTTCNGMSTCDGSQNCKTANGNAPSSGSCTPTGATGCASTFCINGVCCGTACGGLATPPCGACNGSTGGSMSGTCETASFTGMTCLTNSVCDGVTAACPSTCSNNNQCTSSACCTSGNTCTPETNATCRVGGSGSCLDCSVQTNNKKCISHNCGCIDTGDCDSKTANMCTGGLCVCGAGSNPCTVGSQCCVTGACVANTQDSSCGSNCTNCSGNAAGPHCVSGHCGCGQDTDCATGFYCSKASRTCTAEGGAGSPCTPDTDCYMPPMGCRQCTGDKVCPSDGGTHGC